MNNMVTLENAAVYLNDIVTVFASDLQLPPGKFPMLLETSLGNAKPFVLVRQRDGDSIEYKQRDNDLSLIVFND